MLRKLRLFILLISGLALMACALVTTPQAAANAPDVTAAPTLPSVPKVIVPTVALPAPTTPPAAATSAPTSPPAPAPTTVIVAPSASGLPASAYTDDRSTPGSLIVSLFNAVNRHEYLRAYSYWQTPAESLGTLASFAKGYANTASIDLVFGPVSGSGGAGQMYFTVPAIIKGTATNGAKANYAACYIVHMSQPTFQGAPPYIGMMIIRGKAQPVDIKASDAADLAAACGGPEYPMDNLIDGSPASVADISKANYLDNRSGPVEVVSSLENALNTKEYVRAYSYWENPTVTAGPFTPYAAGFSDTGVITATFGTPTSDGGAGQIHYKVPLILIVNTVAANTTQTFVGCYTLHLSQPGMQAALPFAPLGIIGGKFKKVDNSVNTAPLLASACS